MEEQKTFAELFNIIGGGTGISPRYDLLFVPIMEEGIPRISQLGRNSIIGRMTLPRFNNVELSSDCKCVFTCRMINNITCEILDIVCP